MKKIATPPESPARRQPRQARAQHKVELILESATRLLDGGDLASLTTNAVAEMAGVSIGTLYQYFNDKQAILDALSQRELGGLAEKALASLKGEVPATPGERTRRIVRAVLGTYGGRGRVHRLLMEYGLSRGTSSRLNPLYASIASLLSSGGVVGPAGKSKPIGEADAFVLTYAIAGVLRAYVALGEEPASRQDVEDALVRLTVGFVGQDGHGKSNGKEERPEEASRNKARRAGKALTPGRSRPASRSTPG